MEVTIAQIDNLKAIMTTGSFVTKEPMARHTTFRVGGDADVFAEPTKEEVPAIIDYCRKEGIPVTVIGNGSNLLVGDKGIRGVVLCIGKGMSDVTVEGDVITAGAGALLSKVAAAARDASLTGMEFAAGIPGSLGGAVVMNAGAYGGEMKDILVDVTYLTPGGEIVTVPATELDLSYRHSAIMEMPGSVVLEARIRLQKGDKEAIQAQMSELAAKRQEKQPLNFPSAGSTFKRPEGYFAGKLIEDAGLRGFTMGHAQVSEKHCGFVVNLGGATAAEIRSLMEEVTKRVRENSGVELVPEVRFVGEFE